MARSRLETVGSVFSRTRDLIRAGVLNEKPLWFDIYNAFPPLREPVFRRPRLRYGKAKAAIQDILYPEDRIRAFVEKYIELQKLGETDEEKLFVETGKALLAAGVILRRVEARTQKEGGHVSWESEPTGVKPQTVLEKNQPLQEVPQDQHLETSEEQPKGLSPP
ncbi:28S ribosomal protein S23, mitochondrial isoform X2 [Neomonachus schauinslandi]|uniref:Small ribosomal subunit protein mS23 n=1 Tax=Neomonachus schauinslandi TaxID=29088 RepID=A0A2Y9IEX5_NEOSC|nr:28S ribosomal protein S23, mitochondrial isoform X2 [Neomonachus schauinslandi]